jgi:hypothetical protein
MMNEFVPYDIAFAMKEIGFDEPCMSKYSDNGSLLLGVPQHLKRNSNVNKIEGMYLGERGCTAPLYQQAFRWFREEYKLFSEVNLTTKQENVESFEFFVLNVNEPLFESDDYTVYEEAELACLRKLIEIVNQNKDSY